MTFDWLSWSNPISLWWALLVAASGINIGLWLSLHRYLRQHTLQLELLVLLSAVYVFGCAFRAVLPRADVQRICLFDSWLSSVFLGRSIATIAEICFVVQWAIVLRVLASSARSDFTRIVALAIVPLIVIAEGYSWYAVITTNYLGNVIENSLWAVTFLAIAAGLLPLVGRFNGVMRIAIATALVGIGGYAAFMVTVDVPMYFGRWQADLADGKELLGLLAGLHDAASRWVVTHDITAWRDEIAWKSLYFSMAVWASLALCGFVLVKDRLFRYRTTPVRRPLPRRRLSAVSVPIEHAGNAK